jgi:hypothetical protein
MLFLHKIEPNPIPLLTNYTKFISKQNPQNINTKSTPIKILTLKIIKIKPYVKKVSLETENKTQNTHNQK